MEKKQPPFYASVIIIDTLGQVLLGKRKEDGIWTSPGGSGEEGETPEKAAVREAFEECGMAIDSRFLRPLPPIETRNGKLCHCFLYVAVPGTMTTSKLDPDQEVGTWKWFSMDQIPNSLKDDPRRFESVRNAYMKFHGITKSLIDKLEKGGKPAQAGEIRNFGGKQYQKLGNGEWVPYIHEEEKKLQAEQNKNKVVSLTDKLKQKVDEKKQVTSSQQHLSDLQTQAIIPDQQTRSEKPVFTSVDSAMAHGYDAKDFREVGNFYYDRAQKIGETIEKLKNTGQKVDPNYEKIKQTNLRYAKSFLSQANRIDDRQAKTKTVAKSDTPADRQQILGKWLDRFQNAMNGYEYGQEPRVVAMDQGDLYLVQVDKGTYSGVFKSQDVMDRIERMPLPSIVTFCLAKGWIQEANQLSQVEQAGMSYAAQMDYYGGQLDAADKQDNTVNQLIEKLEAAKPTPANPVKVESTLDKILRLVDKLTN